MLPSWLSFTVDPAYLFTFHPQDLFFSWTFENPYSLKVSVCAPAYQPDDLMTFTNYKWMILWKGSKTLPLNQTLLFIMSTFYHKCMFPHWDTKVVWIVYKSFITFTKNAFKLYCPCQLLLVTMVSSAVNVSSYALFLGLPGNFFQVQMVSNWRS